MSLVRAQEPEQKETKMSNTETIYSRKHGKVSVMVVENKTGSYIDCYTLSYAYNNQILHTSEYQPNEKEECLNDAGLLFNGFKDILQCIARPLQQLLDNIDPP